MKNSIFVAFLLIISQASFGEISPFRIECTKGGEKAALEYKPTLSKSHIYFAVGSSARSTDTMRKFDLQKIQYDSIANYNFLRIHYSTLTKNSGPNFHLLHQVFLYDDGGFRLETVELNHDRTQISYISQNHLPSEKFTDCLSIGVW